MGNILIKNTVYLLSLYKSAGHTIEELCNALEINPSTYTRWRQGRRCPDPYNQKRLAEFFGLSVEEIINADIRKLPDPPRKIKTLIMHSYIGNATAEQLDEISDLLEKINLKDKER